MSKLPVAFSPCPNDTFLFHAWAKGRVGKQVPIEPILADIQNLNERAIEGKYPLVKVSMHCLGHILDRYHLLPVGCALGHALGPKLIAKKGFRLEQLTESTIAIPGRDTTANLLCHLLLPPAKKKIFTSYNQIVPMIASGEVDAGVIIHETRFTFVGLGLYELADLGALWEEKYQIPLPLGGLAVQRNLAPDLLQNIIQTLQESLLSAWLDPQASANYVLKWSQEKDPRVVGQHIATYVTQETFRLSPQGVSSIDTLLRMGRESGHMPPCAFPWMAQ